MFIKKLILVGALVTFPKVSFCAETNPQTESVYQGSVQDRDAFFRAAIKGDLPTIQRLLTSQSNIINVTNEFGITPLMIASFCGRLEVVKVLIQAGANVNATDKDGTTALMIASFFGHLEVVNTLIGAGANVNATYHNGDTALMAASDNGHLEVVNALIQAGAH